MSYSTIHQSANDPALRARVQSAAVQEAWNNPTLAGNDFAGNVRQSATNGELLTWPVCIASDVEAAYASALAGGNPNPGGDESVITDGMILANVQAKWPENLSP